MVLPSKDAVVFLLDVAHSTSTLCTPDFEDNNDTTRFDCSKNALLEILHYKLMKQKSHLVSVCLIGSPNTNNSLNDGADDDESYAGIEVISELEKSKLETIERVSLVEPSDGNTEGSNLVDALIVAIDMLYQKTANKKFDRKIWLLTDAQTPLDGGDDDLEMVFGKLKELDVQLNIIGLDFKIKEENENNNNNNINPIVTIGRDSLSPLEIKRENEKLLNDMALLTGGRVIQVNDIPSAISGIQIGNKTRPQILNMPFYIGKNPLNNEDDNGISLPLKYFIRVSKESPPTLKKESIVSYNKEEEGSGKVEIDRTYINPDEPDLPIEIEERIKGFRYGNSYVPVRDIDLSSMKLEYYSDSGLMLLGFIHRDLISRAYYLDKTTTLVPLWTNEASCQATSALCYAMRNTNKIGIGRFIPRKNSEPQLVAIYPDDKPLRYQLTNDSNINNMIPSSFSGLYDRFILQKLPYQEDLRNFTFPSFESFNQRFKPSKSQEDAMDDFLTSFNLSNIKLNNKSMINLYQPGSIPNPFLSEVNNIISKRLINENYNIPNIILKEKLKRNKLLQNNILLDKNNYQINKLKDTFKFKKMKTETQKRKSYWTSITFDNDDINNIDNNDINDLNNNNNSNNNKRTRTENMNDVSDINKIDIPDKVGTVNPNDDFNLMINSNDDNLKLKAFEDMKNVIIQFIEMRSRVFYQKAIYCIKCYRLGCIKYKHSRDYNQFLENNIKKKYSKLGMNPSQFWKLLLETSQNYGIKSVGLITYNEDPDNIDNTIDDNVAKDFWKEEIREEVQEIKIDNDDDDDDLFGDML